VDGARAALREKRDLFFVDADAVGGDEPSVEASQIALRYAFSSRSTDTTA